MERNRARWLTTGRLARRLHMDPKTLRKYARLGKVPAWRSPLNGYWWFDEQAVRHALRRPIDRANGER